MKKLSEFLTWPMAAVIIAGGVMFTLITIFGSPDVRDTLYGVNGLLWTIVAYLLRSPLNGGGSSSGPTAIVLCLALAVGSAVPGCVHRQHMRAIDRIEERCVNELDQAQTEEQIEEIRTRCTQDLLEVISDARNEAWRF